MRLSPEERLPPDGALIGTDSMFESHIFEFSYLGFAPVCHYFCSPRLHLQVPLPLANATEAGWAELQQMEDQVLAISALFGMFQVSSSLACGVRGLLVQLLEELHTIFLATRRRGIISWRICFRAAI